MNRPPTWVLASGNAGKLRELRQRLQPSGVKLVPQARFAVAEVAETGATFVENAIIKARAAAAASGLPALADDSGLRVEALGGAPGVISARFAGEHATDAQNNARLLADLDGETHRQAQFCCALVWMKSAGDPLPRIFQATWEGYILESPRGRGGFGYDPLFYLPDLKCASAELSAGMKNRISHRGRAVDLLLASLAERPF